LNTNFIRKTFQRRFQADTKVTKQFIWKS